ncbi:MAG: ribonuclease HI family protein [bacterium]|nr:ribonuclease HI family protein [bacterium]
MSDKILSKKIIIYTDGGSRGNPGPSALGAVIADEKGKIIKKYGQFLGEMTNNQAEYQAVIFALKKVKALLGKDKIQNIEVEVRSDSELLVSQLGGKFKILDENIQKLFILVWNLKIDYKKVDFVSIPREKNQEADALANQALDEQGREKTLF